MVDFLTSAWTIADSPNPRMSAQVIAHVIDPVMARACRTAWSRLMPAWYPAGVSAAASPRNRRRRRRRLACVSTGSGPGDPAAPAVELAGLVKRYGQITAVDRLSLTAARGAVTGILGPNGAGKTTTIEICEGYRRPDQGTVRVLGLDPVRDTRALRPRVGVMLQSGGVPPAVPAADYLNLLSRFHASPIAPAQLLDLMGLTTVARTPYKRPVRRPAAAAVPGRGDHRPSGAGLPRRAHGRPGPAGPARHLGPDRAAAPGGRKRHPDHALHGRGRTSLRLRRHHRSRPAGGRGHARAADRHRRPAQVPRGAGAGHRQPADRAAGGQRGEGIPGRPLRDRGARGGGPAAARHGDRLVRERGVLANSLRIESRTLEDVFLELTGKELRCERGGPGRDGRARSGDGRLFTPAPGSGAAAAG